MLGILFIVLTNYFRILAPQLTGYVVNAVVTTIEAGGKAKAGLLKEKKNDIIVQKIIPMKSDMAWRRFTGASALMD